MDPAIKELDFEICSWLINCCKSGRTPDEFGGICIQVADKKRPERPPAFELPPH